MTQYFVYLRLSKRIVVVLQDGRIVDEGMLEELLGRCEEMQQLWQMDTAVGE